MLTVDGPTGIPVFKSFEKKEELVAAVREYYRRVMSGDFGVSQSIWMFEGHRIRMVGDPIRRLLFEDGSREIVIDEAPMAADETKLLPPSVRIKLLPKPPV